MLVHCFLPKTKKPAEVRMGKGKGKISSHLTLVRPGQLFIRMQGITRQQALEAYMALAKKLAFRINFS